MLLLDAAALVALLGAEPAASTVRSLIDRDDAAIPAPNLAEVIDQLSRRRGVSQATLRGALEPLLDHTIAVIDATAEHGWRAGLLRARHYHRQSRPLSVLDCLLLACAAHGDAIVTSDGPLIAAAREEGIGVEAIPDSMGGTPA